MSASGNVSGRSLGGGESGQSSSRPPLADQEMADLVDLAALPSPHLLLSFQLLDDRKIKVLAAHMPVRFIF